MILFELTYPQYDVERLYLVYSCQLFTYLFGIVGIQKI